MYFASWVTIQYLPRKVGLLPLFPWCYTALRSPRKFQKSEKYDADLKFKITGLVGIKFEIWDLTKIPYSIAQKLIFYISMKLVTNFLLIKQRWSRWGNSRQASAWIDCDFDADRIWALLPERFSANRFLLAFDTCTLIEHYHHLNPNPDWNLQ